MEGYTHQKIVDDIMVMGHPSIQEARTIKGCLQEFGAASGVEVNENKSHVFSTIPLEKYGTAYAEL